MNAHAITAEEWSAFLTAYAEEAAAASVFVLIGSLPPGAPVSLYRDLLARTPGKVILDARGEELLEDARDAEACFAQVRSLHVHDAT